MNVRSMPLCVTTCGVVSERLGWRYGSGRTHDWLKFKNPNAPGGESASTVKTIMAAIQMSDYSLRIQAFIVMTRFSAIVDGHRKPRAH